MPTRKQHKHHRTLTYKKLHIPSTVIPKGTLLFRGVKDIESDFVGIPQSNGTYKLTPYHNVFFYPYPFVADLDPAHYDDSVHYNQSVEVYETLHDIPIVSLITPSRFTRAARLQNQFLTNCDKVIVGGRSYDPCFTPSFLRANPHIMGAEQISGTDGRTFRAALSNLPTKEKKYFHWSKNARGGNSIKEYSLYPLKKRYDTIVKDVDTWKKDHKEEFNYRHVTSLSRSDKNKDIHEFMESKAQLNASTKLWSLKK